MFYDSLTEYLQLIVAIVGPLTVILGFFYKYVIEPREKRKAKEEEQAQRERMAQEKEYQDKMLDIARQQIEPIHAVLEEIKEITVDSEYDRKHLNEIAKTNTKKLGKHEERLDDHAERIIILEAKSGAGEQEVFYKEKYGSYRKEDE